MADGAAATTAAIAVAGFVPGPVTRAVLRRGRHPGSYPARSPAKTANPRLARLIGVTFYALTACLTVDSTRALAHHARSGQPVPGPAVTAATRIVPPVLATATRRTGHGHAPHWPAAATLRLPAGECPTSAWIWPGPLAVRPGERRSRRRRSPTGRRSR